MNRRTCIGFVLALFAAPFAAVAKVAESILVINYDPSGTYATVKGSLADLSTFYHVWMKDMWPDWKTHQSPAGRNEYAQAMKYARESGSVSFSLNSYFETPAGRQAFRECFNIAVRDCGIKCVVETPPVPKFPQFRPRPRRMLSALSAMAALMVAVAVCVPGEAGHRARSKAVVVTRVERASSDDGVSCPCGPDCKCVNCKCRPRAHRSRAKSIAVSVRRR